MATMIGAARVVFGADTEDFDTGAKGVEGAIARLQEVFDQFETRLKRLGTGFTLAVTVPFAAMTRAVDKGAGEFEAQMKRVDAALGGVSGKELEALGALARKLGPAVGKGATEAASGIDALARAGVTTSDIMGGALKSTLDLAAAGMTDVEPAAALMTDAMGQFHKTAAELPQVVGDIVGALDASKFEFADFQKAISSGGGVAASAGISFRDFATAVAATSSQFSSGETTGTAFKTYIQSLNPVSKEAGKWMDKLGLKFFDVNGKMKPLAEQADMLRKTMADLNDETKSEALKTMFGSDAAATAIALIDQGREGIERLQDTIAKGDVAGKIAKSLEGSAAASQRIANAWESVKISLGLDTGLLAFTTAIKNAFASILETIANAPPAMKRFGTMFAAIGAAIGPVLLVLGHVAAFLVARFAASFGIVGRIIGLFIAPISTIVTMLGEMGLARVLGMLASRLLGLLGPIGWAIGAVLLFKDSIIAALSVIWDRMVAVLGPPLEAIMAKLQGLFGAISSGPLGDALNFVVSVVRGIVDVLGTVLGAALIGVGEVFTRVINAILQVVSGLLDGIRGFVDLISALLSGDFSRAWEAAGNIVGAAAQTLRNVLIALFPELSGPLRAIYEAARYFLAQAFPDFAATVGKAVQFMVAVTERAFPNIVGAAKAVYQGVKTWLVDHFGEIAKAVGNTVKWIGDQYVALKARLGLGGDAGSLLTRGVFGSVIDAAIDLAARFAVEFPATLLAVSLDDAGKKKTAGSGSTAANYDADNREQLRLQAELEAARMRNDQLTVRALEDRLDRSRQIEAYQRAGLSLAEATKAAERDMALLGAARAEQDAQALVEDQRRFDLRVAEIEGNGQLRDSLEKQQYLQERIDYWLRQRKTLTEATAIATAEQVRLDGAVAAAKERAAKAAEAQRQIDLARARGDSEERIRALETEADIEKRVEELRRGTDASGPMDEASARAQAETEAMEGEMARRQGIFRDTIKGGFRAALDGNFGSWFEGWWKDRVAKGLEDALNSLADVIAQAFSGGGASGGGGMGGLLGGIASAIGGLFGGGGGSWLDVGSLPGFKTGGSFTVGGPSGIDRAMVAFRATAGEMVHITRPGQDIGGPAGGVTFDLRGAVMTEDLLRQMEVIAHGAAGEAVGANNRLIGRRARARLA